MDFQLDQLRALRASVDEGSFEAAASHLNITPSAISQRIKALESAVGRVLLQRTKPVRPTESGMTMLRLARQFDLLAADAAKELAPSPQVENLPVRVPFVVNADSLETWVLPALVDVPPHVCVEIHREDQEHSTALLRDGTAMAAITSVAQPVQGCVVRRLGVMRYRPMASPRLVRAWFQAGVTTAAFGKAPVMAFNRRDDLQDRYLRRRTRQALRPPRHFVPSSAGFLDSIRLGLGWGMLPDLQTTEDEAAGRLIDIDPGGHIDVPLYWQQWKLRSPALTAIAEAIESAAGRQLV